MKKEVEDEKKGLKKNELNGWEEENWLKKAEIEGNKVLIPSRWVMSMLLNACKQTRIVPYFETRKSATYTNYVSSCMIDNVSPVANIKELKPYGAFVSAQGTKRTGNKVWRIRPMLKKWKVSFDFIDPYGRMKKEELQELLEYGGMFIGIGDNRKNNFGRFEVKSVIMKKG